MLRILFGEPKRKDSGLLLEASQAVRNYITAWQSTSLSSTVPADKKHRLVVWSKSFLDALDELEQSQYCCDRYAEQVSKAFIEDMDPQELDDYRRFVYFYKNAFIRLFSILDKVGYFLNELLELQTGAVKSRFSYFTVLRRMHEIHMHDALEQQLYAMKNDYKKPLERLRNQRNMEIHFINAEMLDDLSEQHPTLSDRIHVENVGANVADLRQGFEMVCRAFNVIFTYITALVEKEQNPNHGRRT
jgi:hypothetical protein